MGKKNNRHLARSRKRQRNTKKHRSYLTVDHHKRRYRRQQNKSWGWLRPVLIGCGLAAAFLVLFFFSQQAKPVVKKVATKTVATEQVNRPASETNTIADTTTSAEVVTPTVKSEEAKKLAMDADMETMTAYGLQYDYAHLSLVDTVKAFLTDIGADPSQVAFTYKNTKTNEVFAMNDTQPMTAGSTYKLPLNMLVVDAVSEGKVSATERYDITHTNYEYQAEHDAYVANYHGAMTISEMQYGSIVVSENTPAYALAERLGGVEKAYSQFNRYGTSKTAPFPTFQLEGNKTTTSYYIQVLDYLYKHQKKYADLMSCLDEAFPGQWYEQYNPGLTIYQKPGYVREALNVDAIVMEETPYLIALYTAGLGGASAADVEINDYGYGLVIMLTYVINEWHRVNMNPPLLVSEVTVTSSEEVAVTEPISQSEGSE